MKCLTCGLKDTLNSRVFEKDDLTCARCGAEATREQLLSVEVKSKKKVKQPLPAIAN